MPRGYRYAIVALAGIASVVFFIWYGLEQQAIYQYEASRGHADYASRAADEVKQGCAIAPPGDKAGCIKKAVSEYRLKTRDNQRDYADLVAQQTSALWTGIMGVAALIGMALSVVGVLLVWTTFREQRRANDVSSENLAETLRPWILMNGYRFTPLKNIRDATRDIVYQDGLQAYILWQNSGASAALLNTSYLEHRIIDHQSEVPRFIAQGIQTLSAVACNIPYSTKEIMLVGQDYEDFISGRRRLILYACARYSHPNRQNHVFESEVCLSLSVRGVQMHPDGSTHPNIVDEMVGLQNNTT